MITKKCVKTQNYYINAEEMYWIPSQAGNDKLIPRAELGSASRFRIASGIWEREILN